MSDKSRKVLQSQKKVYAALVIGVVVVTLAIGLWTIKGSAQPPRLHDQRVDLPGDKVNPAEVWMTRLEGDNRLLDQKIQYLEGLILESKKTEENKDRENRDLRAEIARVKQDLKTHSVTQANYREPQEILIQDSVGGSCSGEIRTFRPPLAMMVMDEGDRRVSHIDEVIPAGTTVRALLVSSVDAPCSVCSNCDPQPIKLRLLDDGHLPKCVQARVKGGVLIGSAYGDLSSERVYMRLERFTQVNPNGEFIETDVTGYVSGEDGKYGVRGVVVDKSEKLVASAAFSGFFSGVSQFLQATVNAQNVRDATRGLPNDLRWDLVKEGGLSGCASSLDRLAEYYICRAEQIQPVIEVAAGRIVDVTFTYSAEVGDLHTKDRVKETRERSREQS